MFFLTSDIVSRAYSSSPAAYVESEPFAPNLGAQADSWECMKAVFEGKLNYSGIWYSSGRGSGKTYWLARAADWIADHTKFGGGMITANTYGQLKESTIPKCFKAWREGNVPIFYDKMGKLVPLEGGTDEIKAKIALNAKAIYVGQRKMHFSIVSAERFTSRTERSSESARGGEVIAILGDELTYADRSVIENFVGSMGRTRDSSAIFLMAGTSNRNNPKNWAYDFFTNPARSDDLRRNYIRFMGSAQENPSLPPSFFERMKATLTPELYDIEVLGLDTVYTEGQIAKYFIEAKHVQDNVVQFYNKKHPICLSFDFNVSPATHLVGQYYDETFYIFAEGYLLNSNTFESAQSALKKVRKILSSNNKTILLYGDATGGNKSANSLLSNWEIIENELSRYNSYRQFGSVNPAVIDSINSLNLSLSKHNIVIDSSCVELIKDLETVSYRNNEIDKKKDAARTHLFDCLRYFVHFCQPYQETEGIILKEYLWSN